MLNLFEIMGWKTVNRKLNIPYTYRWENCEMEG